MLKRCDLFWPKSAILGFLKSPFDPKKTFYRLLEVEKSERRKSIFEPKVKK